MPKSHENFMGESRLLYLSYATGITFMSGMDSELWPLQVEASALSTSLNSFGCALFPTNLTSESGKVVYTKVVENFISLLAK